MSKLQQIIGAIEEQNDLLEELKRCEEVGEPFCEDYYNPGMALEYSEPIMAKCSDEQLRRYIETLEHAVEMIKGELACREDVELDEEEECILQEQGGSFSCYDDGIPF